MKITELTPPTPERTFSIDLSEDELRTLACILGEVGRKSIDSAVNSYQYHCRPNNTVHSIAHDIYFGVDKIFSLDTLHTPLVSL